MYVTVGAATQEAVWLRTLLTDIQAVPEGPTVIMGDNQGALQRILLSMGEQT